MGEFADHYAREWLLWHRSGVTDTRVCDMAALAIAVTYCHYHPDYLPGCKPDWMAKIFHLDTPDAAIHGGIPDYFATTLAALRALRPTISEQVGASGAEGFDELLQLALPIERILVLGGDHRLAVDANTLLNGYGCRPFPRPEAITFSSSTATSISKYAYDLVEKRRQQFISEAAKNGLHGAASVLAQEVRVGIFRLLNIGANVADVVITASGTDSFLIAQGLARLIAGGAITTLIVGVEESGSGVKLALQERHFADDTALSRTVHKGQPLSAENSRERQVDIPVRDAAGNEVQLRVLDGRVRELVAANVEAGNYVVVHAMNHSKLGYSGPSQALLLELKRSFGSRVCIVVDACQMRLDREEIIKYLEHQMIVIITGSKYFTGPPFCGAILIPEQVVQEVKNNGAKLDIGFNSYCAREDFPPRLKAILRGRCQHFNLGSLFRWIAAIAEMERYYEIPPLVRSRAVAQFCGHIEDILQAAPFLELHYQSSCRNTRLVLEPGELSGRRMIFPFFLYRVHDGIRELCSEKQVQQIYALLNQDCSRYFPYRNAREYRLLAQLCHIGQPVPALHHSGIATAVLRISAGARIFSESFCRETGNIVDTLIEDEFWQIGVVLGKIELLLNAMSPDISLPVTR